MNVSSKKYIINLSLIFIVITFISCEKKHKFYYDSGELHNEFITVNGLKEGESKTYFKSGKLKLIKRYHKDIQVGFSELYRENGELEAISKWENGSFINNKAFDENGELVVYCEPLSQEIYNRYEKYYQILYTYKDSITQKNYFLDSILLFSKIDSTIRYKYYAKTKKGLLYTISSGKVDSLEYWEFRKFIKEINSN